MKRVESILNKCLLLFNRLILYLVSPISEWLNKNKDIILGWIKLIISVLAALIFPLNSPVAHHLYPDYNKDWEVFIPMNDLRYDAFSLIIFMYALASCLKTRYKIGDLFLYAGMIMSLFDVLDRNFFHIYKTIDLDFMFTIPFSIMLATLIYVRIHRD